MGVDGHWQQRLQHCPQFIRDTKPCRCAVVGCSLSVSFWCFSLFHCFFPSPFARAWDYFTTGGEHLEWVLLTPLVPQRFRNKLLGTGPANYPDTSLLPPHS